MGEGKREGQLERESHRKDGCRGNIKRKYKGKRCVSVHVCYVLHTCTHV